MDLRQKAASNFIWRFLERFGAQGVGFVVSMVLSRRLGPEIYGLVATVTVFTSIVNVFVTCGLNDALIQKKNADDLDFSTVFYFNIFMCLTLYGLMYAAAPLIARIYEEPELTAPIRGLSLILVFGGIKNIQVAYVSRNLMFKRFFYATLAGTLAAAVVGIWMAYNGYGVWALIVQNLVNTTIDTVILWLTVHWRPKRMFSFERLKGLFSYAWKLLASSLVDTVYNKLAQIVIGLRYTKEDLAYYNKGDTIPSLLVTNINDSTNNILLPIMSSEQDDIAQVRAMTRRAIQLSSFIIMPMMAGLAAVALPFVRLVLADEWLLAVPYLQIFSFVFAFYCVHTANLNAIKALGRSDLFLKLEIIKKVVGIVTLIVTAQISVMAMALGQVFTCITGQIINSWPNRKLLGYSYREQLKDMLPHILLSVGMGLTVWAVALLGLSDLITLLIQIPLGIALYIAGAKLFKLEIADYAIGLVKGLLNRNKKTE
ncbi:MAG: lipopolysaccharide biosynthesis protein [Lachnospiraceae bacterium]|nr:lipopolysaccharide biosynthesis protein [Lachnospiraceae bacterium]